MSVTALEPAFGDTSRPAEVRARARARARARVRVRGRGRGRVVVRPASRPCGA